MGSPSSYNAHREHASFVESDSAQCYPDSRIAQYWGNLHVELTEDAIYTDRNSSYRFGVRILQMSTLEDYTAFDEVSGETMEQLLEMTHETTDRQGYPVYDGTDLSELYTGSSDTSSTQPGLTTDSNLEKGTVDIESFYDTLMYKTTGPKLKAIQRGLKWYTLTKERPFRNIPIKLGSKSKAMIPYSSMVTQIIFPQQDTKYQTAHDLTSVNHFSWIVDQKFNEWNREFNMQRA